MEQPSQAEAVETREDNQPFPFTFEHRWIALAQPRSTMFPMLSSPPPLPISARGLFQELEV